MTFEVPNEFVPQSGQAISSEQMDENFAAVGQEIDDLNNALGTQSGVFSDVRKVLYQQRPAFTGATSTSANAPASNEFVDRKYLEATRGCRIGDMIISINPNALPNDYGVVWAQMQGQQLSQTTYPDFYALCQSIGGTDTGRYNPALGATTGNFTAPDWRGLVPMQILAGGAALTNKVPNFVAANWLGSIVGESAHHQAGNEVGTHTHTYRGQTVAAAGGSNAYTYKGGLLTTDPNQADTDVQAMNIVQQSFISMFWVRIK